MATITTVRPQSVPEVDQQSTLAIPRDVRLVVDADDFAKLCAANQDMRLEPEHDGGLIVMTTAAFDGGARNADLTIQLGIWNRATRLGTATLPDGSVNAPDAS